MVIIFKGGQGLSILLILVKNIVYVGLSALQLAMFARAILSWFVFDGRLVGFLHIITEPFIIPVRNFLYKMNWLQDSPIDFSFLIAMVLISILRIILI